MIKKVKVNSEKVTNGKILIIFIYLKFLISIFFMFKSQTIIKVLTVVSTIIFLSNTLRLNNFKINKKMGSIFFIITCLYLVNFLSVDYKYQVLKQYIDFMSYNLLVGYLMFRGIDYKRTLIFWYKMSVVLVIIMFVIINIKLVRVNYMFLGIYMSYCSLIISYNYFSNKCLKDLFLMGMVGELILFYSNRGAFLTYVFGIIISYILCLKKTKLEIIKLSLKLISLAIIIRLCYNKIILLLLVMLENLNIKTYSVYKFINMLQGNIKKSSSGRDILYLKGIEIIKNNTIGIPRGVAYFGNYVKDFGLYVHNLILDFLIVFGPILGFLFLGLLLLYVLKYIFSQKILKEEKVFFILILIFMLTRTFFSSTFIIERSFWIIVFMILSKNTKATKF